MTGVGWYLNRHSSEVGALVTLVGAAEGCSWTEAVGLEPSVARFVVREDQLKSLEADPVSDLLSPLNFDVAGLSVPIPTEAQGLELDELVDDPPPNDRIPLRANLVIVQVNRESDVDRFEKLPEKHVVAIRDLFLVEARRVGGPYAATEKAVYELTYANVARYWDDHGVITRGYNVRRQGLKIKPKAGVPLIQRGRFFDASTLRDGSEFFTLREIVEDVLLHLPGRPRLVEFPRGIEGPLEAIDDPVEVRCWAARPKVVLQGILDAFGLIPVVHRDRTVSVFLPGAGTVGERADGRGGDNTRPHDFDVGAGAFEGLVPPERNFYARRIGAEHAEKVLITGPRSIFTASVDYCVPALQLETVDPETGEQRTELVEFTRVNFRRLGIPVDVDIQELLRIPLLRGKAWPSTLEGVSQHMRRILRDQLGRVFLLPYEFRRLCPILDRAEQGPSGDRLPPMAEAFSFETVRAQFTEEVTEELREAEQQGVDLRSDDEINLQELDERIAFLEQEINRLRYVNIEDLMRIANRSDGEIAVIGLFEAPVDIKEEQPEVAQGYGRDTPAPGLDEETLDSNPRKAPLVSYAVGIQVGKEGPRSYSARGGNLDELGQVVVSIEIEAGPSVQIRARGLSQGDLQDLQDLRRVAESKERFGRRLLGEFIGIADVGALDPQDQLVAQIRQRLEAAKSQRIELLKKVDPARGFQEQIDRLTRELEVSERKSGTIDARKRSQIRELRRQQTEAVAKQGPLEQRKPMFAHFSSNRPRREVGLEILSAEEGAFAIDAPGLWLASQLVADPAETFAWIMPVRLTFGTWNRAESDQRRFAEQVGGDVEQEGQRRFSLNEFVHAGAKILETEEDLKHVAADSGHWLPARKGMHQPLFGYTPDNLEGTAVLDPSEAKLITHPDVRYLFGKNSDNADEVQALADQLAFDAVAPPVVQEAGTVAVEGPRNTNPNGRISSVTIESDGSRCLTTLGFDQGDAPLPEVDRPALKSKRRGRLIFEFGIAERDQR